MAAAISKKYVKLDQREHVLTRPGMYIGSVEPDECDSWMYCETSKKMVKKRFKYVPGLFKIFDEILVNAIDHAVRLKNKPEAEVGHHVKNIKVHLDPETGIIEITNDGDGIEVVKHPQHGVYIPELIFGNMLTSTNYDDEEEKVIGGQNGIGAKACNIFSEFFEVETVDALRKQKYVQRFETNMSTVPPPTISKYTKKPYTTIRFKPDYPKFQMRIGDPLYLDMFEVMKKRVYDACAVTDKDITVWLNETKMETKTFEKYVDLYLGSKTDHTRVHEIINDRWEVVASYNDFAGFEQVSFVNGIWTLRGGKHVDYICNQITKKLIDLVCKRRKDVTHLKPQTVKDNLILFVKATIVNPSFDSQSKETLTSPVSKFGSKAEISDKFIDKLYKSGIVDKLVEIANIQGNADLKKTDGKKKDTIRGIYKLDDANWAGTAKSSECTLILTEGDSAKTMVIAGLSALGRDKYGVFPLRGKLLNVKDMSLKKILENEEINHLKKILGLESGKTYTSISDLRYGKIMVLTDQDVDGSHIKGLLFNMFHTLWPSLVRDHSFLTSMLAIVNIHPEHV
jgi:DNA topoisomerase-2